MDERLGERDEGEGEGTEKRRRRSEEREGPRTKKCKIITGERSEYTRETNEDGIILVLNHAGNARLVLEKKMNKEVS